MLFSSSEDILQHVPVKIGVLSFWYIAVCVRAHVCGYLTRLLMHVRTCVVCVCACVYECVFLNIWFWYKKSGTDGKENVYKRSERCEELRF